MGQNKAYRERFFKTHPRCFCCGEPAVAIDHLPSRTCFDGKDWPEGFDFPACDKCNQSTANDEQVLALLSRSHSGPHAPVREEELTKHLAGVRNNHPILFRNMLKKVIESPDPAFGEEASLVELSLEVKDCFKRVLPRRARAFHYKETGIILSKDESLYGGFFTPVNAKGDGYSQPLALPPQLVKRGNKDLSPQFSYMRSVEADGRSGLYVVLFRRAFGAWVGVDQNSTPNDAAARHSLLPQIC